MGGLPYYTCPYCGSNLDHGERCTCRDAKPSETGSSGAQTAAQPAVQSATGAELRPEPLRPALASSA